MRKCKVAALAALLTAGCAASALREDAPPTVPPPPPCPVVSSTDWRAWVNAMPGPGARPTLIVTGKVTLPSAGWTIRWGDVRVLESYPVQVHAELDANPPSSIAGPPQMQEVRGSWPSEQRVGSVTILCRGTAVARISPVETAH